MVVLSGHLKCLLTIKYDVVICECSLILFDNIFQIKANLMNNEWSDVVNDINIELRRPDKLIIQTGSINKVIVSDNWILQVGQWPWNFNLAHKSNVQLELVKSVHLALSPDPDDAGGGIQYLSVKVHDTRVHNSFEIRLKSTEYKDLENRVRGMFDKHCLYYYHIN